MKPAANTRVDEAVERVIEALPSGARDTTPLRKELSKAAVEYNDAREFEAFCSPAKEQKRLIKQLGQYADKTRHLLRIIAPEYVVALDTVSASNGSAPSRPDVLKLRDHLGQLSDDVSKFLEAFEPVQGQPADVPLEGAVAMLRPLLEEVFGEGLTVRMNEHNGKSPELQSPPAKALGLFLRTLNPQLTDTRVVNMIVKMTDRSEVSETNLDRLIQLHDPLDLALIGNSKQD